MKFSRIYILGSLVAIISLLPSCKKWLDVSPANQTREADQFGTQQGFTDALFGIYQKAADPSAYGTQLTFGFLDVLAQRYENKTSQTVNYYGQAARYNYTNTGGGAQLNVQSTIESIWSASYATIAQANYVLKNVDTHPGVLAGSAYNIIKGEALGMRAYLHFDLLRLYAPAYLDGANATVTAIPYMTEFTVTPQSKLTVSGILDKCEKDLKDAETLLSVNTDIDQIAGNQGSTSLDLFLLYRQNHMNYWAVKATLARLYLFKGDKVNALKYAKDVINSAKFRFMTQSELNNDETNVASDMTFTPEHVFSIYISGLKTISDARFKNNAGDPLALGNTTDLIDLYSTRAKLDAMYEQTLAGYGTDLRNPGSSKSTWNQYTTSVVYTKKYYADNTTNVKQRLVALIRLSEMYYIAAEAAPTSDEGVGYLNTVRTARLIPLLTTPITAANLDAELLKEYRKEFYGEGQLWFYYKRKNTVTIPDGLGNPMTAAKYLFQFPMAEIQFGK